MNAKHAILIFALTTCLLTLFLILSSSPLEQALAQATPAFVAFIVILFSKQRKTEVLQTGLLKIGPIKWYFVALFVPFLAIALSYLGGTLLGFFSFHMHLSESVFIYRFLLLTFMYPLIWAVGEEIGWRGFLQPKLTNLFGVPKGIFLTGVLWAAWHLIFIFLGDYYTAGNTILNAMLLTTTLLLLSFTIGWIRLVSQSVWPCVLFHSASNAAWQMWSFQFEPTNPNYIYISGEAGILNILFWAICLLLIGLYYKKNIHFKFL